MTDKLTYQDRLRSMLHPEGNGAPPSKHEVEAEELVGSCGAFGYLRGIRDHASAVEFRFRDGNSTWFPYGWLGPWKYNPSDGLLLKFSGDLVYLVLITGSNLDMPLIEGGANLTSGGIQRHRVLWIREMSKEEIRNVGEMGPTIDSIKVMEFESLADLKYWLRKNAPGFLE